MIVFYLQVFVGQVDFGFGKIFLIIVMHATFLSDMVFLQTIFLGFRIILIGFTHNQDIDENTPQHKNKDNKINTQHEEYAQFSDIDDKDKTSKQCYNI